MREGLPTLAFEDTTEPGSLLTWILLHIGLESRANAIRLVAAIFVPTIVLSLATIAEGRFWWGSVVSDNILPGRRVVGMSFLGDTMVWPFFVLVPAALLLLKRACRGVVRFFSEVRDVISPAYLASHGKDYHDLIDGARRSLAAQDGWRWVRRAAICTGLALCVWNAVTCTFTETIYPYHSDVVHVQGQREPITLPEAVDLPKWDADVRGAPTSWLLARLWVFAGYGLIPVIVYRVLNLVAVLFVFCSALTSHPEALSIKPLSPDRAGGLSSLSEASLALLYVFVPFLFMTGAAFATEATRTTVLNYVLAAAFVPILVGTFFVPLSSVHGAMKRTKQHYLGEVSHQFSVLSEKLLASISSGSLVRGELVDVERSADAVAKLYRRIDELPVWPMELATVGRFGATIAVPLLMLLLQQVLSRLLR